MDKADPIQPYTGNVNRHRGNALTLQYGNSLVAQGMESRSEKQIGARETSDLEETTSLKAGKREK